jgi:hypothetical protein
MNLKNRIVALVTAAAIAVPAVAYAAKYGKNKDKNGDSKVEIKVLAGKGAIKFTSKVAGDSIFVTEGGGNTIVKIDAWNLKTGFGDRDKHQKDLVFKDATRRYIEVIVPTDKIEPGLVDHKIDAVIKFNGKEVKKTVKDFKMKDGFVSGDFAVTTDELGLGEVCKVIDLRILKFDKAVCVEKELTVSASIAVNKL